MAYPVADEFGRTTANPRFSDEVFETLVDRDAFASGLRYEGMLVYVKEDETSYRLKGGTDNADWVVDGGGGAGVLVVADIAARDAIDSGDRYEGLLVYVEDIAKNFQLRNGILDANWVELAQGIIQVADLTERDAISSDSRYEGLLVYVVSEETYFHLKGGVTDSDWKEFSGSGSGAKNFIENSNGDDGTTGYETYTNILSFQGADVNTGANTITILGHAIQQGMRVRFIDGGGGLPAPLSGATEYYALVPNPSILQVSTTLGGLAVDITTIGSGSHTVACARPLVVAGTGSGITWGTTQTDPISGENSLTLAVAANSMGQGGRVPYVIDKANKGKVLRLSIDLSYLSGTYANGTTTTDPDLIWYLYDTTNDVMIEPSAMKLNSVVADTDVTSHYEAEFQTSIDSVDYQLIFHVANMNTAFSLQVGNVAVSPNAYVFGSPISNMREMGTTTIGGVVTPPTKNTIVVDVVRAARNGDIGIVESIYEGTGSGNGSGDYLHTLPAGYAFDSTKVAFHTGTLSAGTVGHSKAYVGEGVFSNPGGSNGGLVKLFAYDATRYRALMGNLYGSYGSHSSSNMQLTLQQSFKHYIRAPMAGFASTVQMSDQTSTRNVIFTGTQASQAVTANVTNVSFTATKDSHTGWATNIYTVQVPGDYWVAAGGIFSASGGFRVYKTGVAGAYFGQAPGTTSAGNGATLVSNCIIGDTIAVRSTTSITITDGHISISRISGPNQIAASEKIRAKYTIANGVVTSTTAPLDAATRVFDSHGCVTTGAAWKFRAPRPDFYRVTCNCYFGNNNVNMAAYKNGAVDTYIGTNSNANPTSGSGLVFLNGGEYLDVRSSASATSNTGGQHGAFHITVESA